MAKPRIEVITEGYAVEKSLHNWEAHSTCSLIEIEEKKILIDPGQDEQLLLKALKKRKLKISDITSIYLTHSHLDHIVNMRLFPNAEIILGTQCAAGSLIHWIGEELFYPSIEILETPGHSLKHYSLLVDTDELGIVAVAGDVFWWMDGDEPPKIRGELLGLEDPVAEDRAALRQSRLLLLDEADWIIPGHGAMFQPEAG